VRYVVHARRWLLRIVITLVVILLFCTAFATFALWTNTGTRMVVSLAGRWIPESVQWDTLSGRLAGPLELRGLDIHATPVHVRIERIVLDWQPWGLLNKRIHSDSVRVIGALVEIDPADSSARTDEAASPTEPDTVLLALPVDVQVDRLAIVGATMSVTGVVDVYDVAVNLSGRPEAYIMSASATVAPKAWHEVAVTLAGRGTLNSIQLDSLTGTAPAGHVHLAGDARWLPQPAWNVELAVSDFDPAGAADALSDWSGDLEMRANVVGSWADGLTLRAVIDTIHGVLREHPVHARAAVDVVNSEYRLDDLHLDWGSILVQADAGWSEHFDVSLVLRIPELSQVLPGAAGSIELECRAGGPVAKPELAAVVADLTASGLEWRGYGLEYLSGTVAVAPGGYDPSRIEFEAQGITGLPVALDSARVLLQGIRSEHEYSLSAYGEEGRLTLNGRGALSDSTWDGSVARLELQSSRAGNWNLAQSADVSLARERVEWSPFCLQTDTGSVCAAGEITPDAWWLDAQFTSLTWLLLRPVMPDGWVMSGLVTGDIRAEADSSGRVRGNLEIAPGTGWLAIPSGEQTDSIHFEQTSIQLVIDGDSIVAGWTMAIAPAAAAPRATLEAGFRLKGLPGSSTNRAFDPEDILMQQPWSAFLRLANVRSEHFRGRGPDVRLEDPVSLQIDLDSRGDLGLTGLVDLSVPAGAFEFPVGDDTTTLHWEASHALINMDSSGMHGTFASALDLDDSTPVGRFKADAHLPGFQTISAVRQHQEIDLAVEGRLDLAVLDAITRTFTGTRGHVEVDVNVSGSTEDAQLLGTIAVEGRTNVTALGIALEDISFTASGRAGGIEYSGGARSGSGRITISGQASRIPSEESPTTLHVEGTDFALVATPQVQVDISPNLDVRSTGTHLDVTGEVLVPRATIEVLEIPESAVQVSDDVVFVGPDVQVDTGGTAVSARVHVRLGDEVHFRGFGFSSFLDGSLEVIERPGIPTQGRGELTFREGRYRGFGQNLTVEPGRLMFGGPIDNPDVDVTAFRIADDRTRAGFKISGTLQGLVMETFSEPERTHDETMSYILFGRPLNQGSESDQMRAADAAAVVGGSMLAMQAATRVGLDDAHIEPGATRNDAAFFAGKYLSPRLYVAYGTGIYESINTLRVRYILSRHWTLQAETGTRETADILYQIERGD